MDDLFYEIERGLDARLYRLSLSVALCIPDICAALESYNGQTNGEKYRRWYDTYMGDKTVLSGFDCWHFRCSFLHQGTTEHEKSNFKKVLFVEPNSSYIFHNNILNDALNIDINIFCREMINAGRQWYEKVNNSENFKNNYRKAFKKYPNGISPYIVGIPVYA